MKKIFIGLLILVLFVALSDFSALFRKETGTIISEITDGDTFKLSSGEKVRLLGIDAPEKGKYYYKQATDKLRELVYGKNITLEADSVDKDQYGRLLRYVFVGDEFVNLEMVKQGYAQAFVVSDMKKYNNIFAEAELEAKGDKVGIWSK